MGGALGTYARQVLERWLLAAPELNCCSVNSPRALGMVSDWAVVLGRRREIMLSWYGPSTAEMPAPGSPGRTVTISQETSYPRDGHILLRVRPSTRIPFTLTLRIPGWSARTAVRLNGDALPGARAGTYFPISREWRRGDTVELRLDLSLHLWPGRRECEGLTSIYRGTPYRSWLSVLTGTDARTSPFVPGNPPRPQA